MKELLPLILILFAAPCFGTDQDGSYILEKCNQVVAIEDQTIPADKINHADAGYCLGLMNGILNLNYLYQVDLGLKAIFCMPKKGEIGISNIQAARIVVKYLKNNPEKLHMHGPYLAIDALADAFPCK